MTIPVLDFGYVELVEAWGSDERIIEAARMSTQKGFEGWGPKEDGSPGDEKLLRYLWKNGHATPFEMAGMIIEVQAPIFVVREWQRHRAQGFSEMSARYAPLPDDNYIPTIARLMLGGGHLTKQAAGTGAELTESLAVRFRTQLDLQYQKAEELYQNALSAGVPKELARACLPVGRYTRMRSTSNLRMWLDFLRQRLDKHAQWEIRQYAEVVSGLVREHFPRTWELFAEGVGND
jgi:thymidylate synthase (FAD)